MDSEGVLSTAYVFDYENNQSMYTVAVRVVEDANSSHFVEGNFTVF